MEEGRSSGVNISDVIEVIETDEMYGGAPPHSNGESDSRRPRAYVKIIEQPASKALRFRYECEGRSAGSIPGVNSTPENKTYPGIQIVGHHGRAVVVVSCVTKDAPYRPHPHNLVGKEGCSRGVCTLKMNTDTITFSNLGIQCVKKKDIEEALKVREEIRVDPFRTGFSHKVQPSSIDLNSVRLCFQVFLEGPKKEEFTIPLRPIVSDPIYDKKAMSDLTICKLSDCSASVAGGREIILLCEKVAKEDIQVRFYEERDGDLFWEALGDFQPTQVHKQVAISFRTPKYKNIDVEKPVKVWVQLRRPSDGAVSESVPFQFVPLDSGRATFWSLRRVMSKKGDYNTFSRILNETSFLTPETQKRKLDSITPSVVENFSEGKKPLLDQPAFDQRNRKDALISGGNLIVVPGQERNESPSSTTNTETANGNAMDISGDEYVGLRESGSKAVVLPGPTGLGKKMDDLFVVPAADEEMKEPVKRTNTDENSQSFNDLITQVAELDEIYAETQERLIMSQTELTPQLEDIIDCRETFRDDMTYSSMQMAMKNPVEPIDSRSYEDVPVIQGPVIDISKGKVVEKEEPEEKLPPLPPKRVKKTPPRRPEESSSLLRDLPKTPDSGKTKQNLFQRLFSKNKAGASKMKTSPSSDAVKSPRRKSMTSPTEESKSFGKWFHQSASAKNLTDLTVNPTANGVSVKANEKFNGNNEKTSDIGDGEKVDKESEDYLLSKDDLELGLDLTEAENYALYTTLAPHASMTELDEISFYYSPVEKGKILTDAQEEVRQRMREVEMKSAAMQENVT
ncbi:hypothetical protein RUM44_011973 [Polyplax serrata]|uniref:RHD domain-containing protein n=1 Tax=Polyplax serrata TaxID=468196 RepID=A0ABR1BE88_POLSC